MSHRPSQVPATVPHAPEVLVYRELTIPSEVVALLRLRHRIYFEERGYGAPKPLGIDLTVHDARARLFGVFRAGELVGGVRLVFRHEQALAPVMHALRAVTDHVEARGSARKQDKAAATAPCRLPSEEAFDLAATLGPRAHLVDVEIGRLAVLHPAVGQGAVLQIIIATLAVLLLERCHFYLYSCATALSRRYARVSNPRWTEFAPISDGIGSDGFPFPKETEAAVAAAEDTPYLEQALAYANALHQRGFIELASHAPAQHAPLARLGAS